MRFPSSDGRMPHPDQWISRRQSPKAGRKRVVLPLLPKWPHSKILHAKTDMRRMQKVAPHSDAQKENGVQPAPAHVVIEHSVPIAHTKCTPTTILRTSVSVGATTTRPASTRTGAIDEPHHMTSGHFPGRRRHPSNRSRPRLQRGNQKVKDNLCVIGYWI